MSISRLPSGRWRAQVWSATEHRNVSVSTILGPDHTSFATKREAKAAREQARAKISTRRSAVTVAQFRDRWITDPLYAPPKRSTVIHNAERTRAFAERYGGLRLDQISDDIVSMWLAGGKRNGTVPALRAMFNAAASAKAGRLITVNPFAGLGIERARGNRDRTPPTRDQMLELVKAAHRLTPPSFAAYLAVACYTGIRPGELDALQWPQIRWDDDEIDITVQYSAKTREFTAPKYGPYTIALVGKARDILIEEADQVHTSRSPYVFETTRGTHYTPSSRTHHWNRVRAACGLGDMSLYLATRHYWGSYALNVLELEPHIIAEQLGHKDGGRLVIELYGHPDKARARRKIREAFKQAEKDDHGTPFQVLEGGGEAS